MKLFARRRIEKSETEFRHPAATPLLSFLSYHTPCALVHSPHLLQLWPWVKGDVTAALWTKLIPFWVPPVCSGKVHRMRSLGRWLCRDTSQSVPEDECSGQWREQAAAPMGSVGDRCGAGTIGSLPKAGRPVSFPLVKVSKSIFSIKSSSSK